MVDNFVTFGKCDWLGQCLRFRPEICYVLRPVTNGGLSPEEREDYVPSSDYEEDEDEVFEGFATFPQQPYGFQNRAQIGDYFVFSV